MFAAVGAGPAAAPASYDYGYGTPAQTAYNTAKTYYQQPTAAAAAYSTTESHYQRKCFICPVSLLSSSSFNVFCFFCGWGQHDILALFQPNSYFSASKPAYSTTNTYPAASRQAAQGVPKSGAYTTSYTPQPAQPNATSYASGYNAPAVVQAQSNAKCK